MECHGDKGIETFKLPDRVFQWEDFELGKNMLGVNFLFQSEV